MLKKLRTIFLGAPREVTDPGVFHDVSLIALLAWVGLGADGLSSSAYGPDEAFRALLDSAHGDFSHLAPLMVLMTAITIAIISFAYSNLIEMFPGGGGGYLVATKLLGKKAGVVSGCALLVDYILTITTSVAAGCDAIWSFLPPALVAHQAPWMGQPPKVWAEFGILAFLVLLNLRGVKESVTFLAPIFMVFIVTHVVMIGYVLISHAGEIPGMLHGASSGLHTSISTIGIFPVAFILLRAYSMGGGTYTGIEAVSNGVTMLREPRVKTGKKTMFLMAISLAVCAGGILLGYVLTHAQPVKGLTMNAVLLENLYGTWQIGSVAVGRGVIIVTLAAEALLLFVAAQTGFLDGPRVLANMAVDSWMPHRFAQLSDTLVTHNGIYLMGAAAAAVLFYTHGSILLLVTMYSINVFITFTLTELGMTSNSIRERLRMSDWKKKLSIHGAGLILCASILTITLIEKFKEGGYVTIVVTGAVIAFCFLVRRHYNRVKGELKRLDDILTATPMPDRAPIEPRPIERMAPTAVITVGSFSGFGLHQILSIQKLFPNYFKNYIFVSVGVVDSGNFKGVEEIHRLEAETQTNLDKYVTWCRAHGLNAESRMAIDHEIVQTVQEMCKKIAAEHPRAIFFAGKLIFQREKWYHRFLHNETPFAIQRRLQFDGIQTIILPIRVL